MTKLMELISFGDELRDKERWLRAFYGDIRKVGEILFREGKTKKERKRLLRELRFHWAAELTRLEEAEDEPGAFFTSECIRLTDSQWDGLFHCYSNPRIPPTNNGTEALISQLKSLERVQGKNPSPGDRFINNAPSNALLGSLPKLPGAEFIASRTPQEIAEIRFQRKQAAHQTGVARLARQNLPKLAGKLIQRWSGGRITSHPPEPSRGMQTCRTPPS